MKLPFPEKDKRKVTGSIKVQLQMLVLRGAPFVTAKMLAAILPEKSGKAAKLKKCTTDKRIQEQRLQLEGLSVLLITNFPVTALPMITFKFLLQSLLCFYKVIFIHSKDQTS